MHKRKQQGLRPQRRAYRFPRVDGASLAHVLDVINGNISRPERYEPERSEIRKTLDRIIAYCDRVENVLNGIERRKRRIERAQAIARSGLLRVFDLNPTKPREFKVWVRPSSSRRDLHWKANVLPPAEEMFRVNDLFIWPPGDIGVQLYWEFYQGIIQLDDLRRLRKCSGYLHDEPYYFIGKKVQQRENYFCSDQCRSDFNYKKKIERSNDARINH